jgi:hypothetical protein
MVADCLPVALAGPGGVAMLHCGWRGLAAGIVERGVDEVGAEAAAVGPGIGPCCYEVGPEVVERFDGGRIEREDRFGNIHAFGQIGIQRTGVEVIRRDPATAVWEAGKYTVVMTGTIVKVVGQMIAGTRSVDELGGVVRIAHFSGEVAQISIVAVVPLLSPVLGVGGLLTGWMDFNNDGAFSHFTDREVAADRRFLGQYDCFTHINILSLLNWFLYYLT